VNLRLVIYGVVAAILAMSWAATCVVWKFAGMEAQVAPLAQRRWDAPTLLAVGTGSAYENPERLGPSMGVAWGEHVWLVDAGRGLAEALRSMRIPVQQPETVLLTSLMPENTLGLDDLLYTGWLAPRARPLRLIGPPGTAALAERLLAAHAQGATALGTALDLPADGARIEALEVGGGWSDEVDGLRVSAGLQPGPPTDALAWRFQQGEDAWVVSSAGWSRQALAEFARGARVLVHEAVFVPAPDVAEQAGVTSDAVRLERAAALHTSILDVGGLATRAGVGVLVLVRTRPPPLYAFQARAVIGETFSGEVLVPEDGDELRP
jgi:ribonuclease Z